MIHIKEDKSYLSNLDLIAIEAGYAELGIHSLNIDCYYTEDQKKANAEQAKLMTREQWNEHCEQVRTEVENQIKFIVDAIDEKFVIYQYKNNEINYSCDNWDLYFWCNFGDMSYVKLNPNTRLSNKQQLETVNAVLELIKNLEVDGVQVRIQYKAIYNEDKVNEAAQEYCETMKNKFIEYSGYMGKIVEFNGRYVFKKKGAKKNAYEINSKTLLSNVLKASV